MKSQVYPIPDGYTAIYLPLISTGQPQEPHVGPPGDAARLDAARQHLRGGPGFGRRPSLWAALS